MHFHVFLERASITELATPVGLRLWRPKSSWACWQSWKRSFLIQSFVWRFIGPPTLRGIRSKMCLGLMSQHHVHFSKLSSYKLLCYSTWCLVLSIYDNLWHRFYVFYCLSSSLRARQHAFDLRPNSRILTTPGLKVSSIFLCQCVIPTIHLFHRVLWTIGVFPQLGWKTHFLIQWSTFWIVK